MQYQLYTLTPSPSTGQPLYVNCWYLLRVHYRMQMCSYSSQEAYWCMFLMNARYTLSNCRRPLALVWLVYLQRSDNRAVKRGCHTLSCDAVIYRLRRHDNTIIDAGWTLSYLFINSTVRIYIYTLLLQSRNYVMWKWCFTTL